MIAVTCNKYKALTAAGSGVLHYYPPHNTTTPPHIIRYYRHIERWSTSLDIIDIQRGGHHREVVVLYDTSIERGEICVSKKKHSP